MTVHLQSIGNPNLSHTYPDASNISIGSGVLTFSSPEDDTIHAEDLYMEWDLALWTATIS